MKTSIVDRILILLAFNIYKITNVFFAVSFIITVISQTLFSQMPLIIGYLFWFSFGVFVFSLAIRNANYFLGKKYEEKNDYYLNLLDKHKKHMADKK
ncbi:MAG: hypothetical protein Q8T08_04765 [Ignavibacteria bacterium]|nr:hypothetical protein [Ignavibacteria bacterium]